LKKELFDSIDRKNLLKVERKSKQGKKSKMKKTSKASRIAPISLFSKPIAKK
jgi:hypothetical protein